jgi:hypothetical protein
MKNKMTIREYERWVDNTCKARDDAREKLHKKNVKTELIFDKNCEKTIKNLAKIL